MIRINGAQKLIDLSSVIGQIYMVLRRITIDSTRLSVAVTPFARVGQYGFVSRQRSRRNPLSPVLSRPGDRGPQLRGLIERYTDGGPNRAHRVQTLSTSLTLSIRLHPISKG